MPKTEQKNYSIEDSTLEEIVESVRLILSYDGEISKIVITKGNIMAEYIMEDTGPPYGKLPDSPVDKLGDIISRIELVPVVETNEVSANSMATIASALIQARKGNRSGTAWLISSQDYFRKWIGVSKPISRLLDLPVYTVDSDKLPNNKLVLLCGKTAMVGPAKCKFGVVMDMED